MSAPYGGSAAAKAASVGRQMTESGAYAAKVNAPFAVLGLRTNGSAVTGLSYLPADESLQAPCDRIAERAVREIERYLADSQFRFSVPLAPGGTPFQQRVWEAIRAVPISESRTYGEIARAVRSAPRAVGQACGANRIALIIPCHRVVGSRGALGGFMGKLGSDSNFSGSGLSSVHLLKLESDPSFPIEIKRWLLTHEGYRFGR